MRDFKKRQFGNNNRGNNSNRGKDKNFGRDKDRKRGDFKPKFQVICDACGEECEVPFRPSGDKPIYCNECFRNKDKKQKNKHIDDEDDDDFNTYKEKHQQSKHAPPQSNNNEELLERLAILEEKIDRILDSLGLDKE